jgi:hypothetical protein
VTDYTETTANNVTTATYTEFIPIDADGSAGATKASGSIIAWSSDHGSSASTYNGQAYDFETSNDWAPDLRPITGEDGKTTFELVPKTATVATTNTLNTITARAAKTWDDTDNAYNSRPDSITYRLLYRVGDNGSWSLVPKGWIG